MQLELITKTLLLMTFMLLVVITVKLFLPKKEEITPLENKPKKSTVKRKVKTLPKTAESISTGPYPEDNVVKNHHATKTGEIFNYYGIDYPVWQSNSSGKKFIVAKAVGTGLLYRRYFNDEMVLKDSSTNHKGKVESSGEPGSTIPAHINPNKVPTGEVFNYRGKDYDVYLSYSSNKKYIIVESRSGTVYNRYFREGESSLVLR